MDFWLELHASLINHPKTLRACRIAKVSRPAMVGHLCILWHWVAEYAQDGDLSDFSSEEIAEAALWEGSADTFMAALTQSGSGFIDCSENGRISIHDWPDYTGAIMRRRELGRERQKRYRDKQSAAAEAPLQAGNVHVIPDDAQVTQTPHSLPNTTNALVTRDNGVSHSPTIPNLTIPNPSVCVEGGSRGETSETADAGASPQRKEPAARGKPNSKHEVEEEFARLKRPELAEAFWAHFESVGWRKRAGPLRNWHAACVTWIANEAKYTPNGTARASPEPEAPTPIVNTGAALRAAEEARLAASPRWVPPNG